MKVRDLIMRFGGIRPLARLLKCPASSVQNWITRKRIPFSKLQKILQLAISHKIGVTAEDILAMKMEPPKKRVN
jgi:hypothetical protein